MDKSLVEDVIQYVRISKPISSTDKPITINGIVYPCHLYMTKLPRTSTEDLLRIDSLLFANSMKSYRPNNITVHLSFNADRPSKLYPDVISWKPFSDIVPSKEYHINNRFDTKKLGIPLPKDGMKRMIGFVYSYIFFKCDLIPFDIEFTAGFDNKRFAMGVLDFGRVSKRCDVSEQRTIKMVSMGPYCNIDANPIGREGWKIGKLIARSMDVLYVDR